MLTKRFTEDIRFKRTQNQIFTSHYDFWQKRNHAFSETEKKVARFTSAGQAGHDSRARLALEKSLNGCHVLVVDCEPGNRGTGNEPEADAAVNRTEDFSVGVNRTGDFSVRNFVGKAVEGEAVGSV